MARLWVWIGAALFAAPGLVLLAGGARLAALGGSLYYLFAGVTLVVVSVMLARRSGWAVWIYGALSVGTIVWALVEVGLDPWALLPRVGVVAGLGLWFALPVARGAGSALGPLVFAASLALVVGAHFHSRFTPDTSNAVTQSGSVARGNDWPLYGNTARGDRFSPANEITPANAHELKVAWTYRTGEERLAGKNTVFEVTPIKVGSALYFCTPRNQLISLDAETGKELWRFNPNTDATARSHIACRGVSYVSGSGTGDFCDSRLLMAAIDNRLHALDLATGKPCLDFGSNGVVDLTVGMGDNLPGYYYPTSPPVIIGHTAVLGTYHLDSQSIDEPPGVVRAFDTRSGALLWAWDVLEPHSRVLGPGEAYPRNTANAWSVFSADAENGLVFIPTGGPPPDFYGGHRTEAYDRYNNAIVALDVTTGNVRWSFKTSHHDIWDLDNGAQPVVIDLDLPRGRVAAVLVPTKRGEIFVLDRVTGKPVFGVEERAVPQGPAPTEWLSPTQPYQVGFPSFAPSLLTEADMWGATMFDQMLCRIEFRRQRYEGEFTPPSLQGTLMYPAFFGVLNWGSVAVDPERQLMLVNPAWLPTLVKLIPRVDADAAGLTPRGTGPTPVVSEKTRGMLPQAGTPYAALVRQFLSPLDYPCNRPPWGAVAVVDLRTQRVLWQRPLGTTRDAAPLGLAFPTGVPSIGGGIVTRGGVAFIGAAIDNYLRAFDVTTGREVWKGRLPAGGQATPMTYVSDRSSRQFVVIAAGGHAHMKTTLGDYIVAYTR